MAQVVIPNPVLNSPFDEPDRHFYFDEDGITDQVVESRRLSSYFVPVPQPKKKGAQLDGKAQDLTRQPEQVRAFRDTWELGIHSYLAYLRERLVVAREMLTDTGSVFVQIGDENAHLARCVLDEVFGSENFVSSISVRKTGGTTGDFLPGTVDFVHWYAREKALCKFRPLFLERSLEEAYDSGYQNLESPGATAAARPRPICPTSRVVTAPACG